MSHLLLGRIAVATVAAAAIAVVAIRPAAATRVELQASRDNTLFDSESGALSSGIGPALFAGRTAQPGNRRALVAFDLNGIPAGAQIDSVQLVLHLNRTSDSVTRTYTLHLVSKAWGEGSSNSGGSPGIGGGGGGAPAAAGDATWLHHAFPNQQWTNLGGDFDAAASALALVGVSGTQTWESTPRFVADVQAWVDGATNNGWVLIGNETVSGTARRFDSRESPNTGDRPRLIVDFSPIAVTPGTWSAIKSTYR